MRKIGEVLENYFTGLSGQVYSTLLILLAISIFAIVCGNAIKKADPLAKQNKRVFLADWFVSGVDKFIKNMMGKSFSNLGPYFAFLFLFLPLGFLIGLLGMPTALGIWSVPMVLALFTFLLIHASAIKYQKWKYFSRFTSPFAVFLPVNILTTFVPIISLSFRILGNVLAGSIMMTLIYYVTGSVSDIILGLFNLGSFNFLGIVVAPVFHLYFDVFGALIQTVVFIFLSGIFISQEGEGYIPAEA